MIYNWTAVCLLLVRVLSVVVGSAIYHADIVAVINQIVFSLLLVIFMGSFGRIWLLVRDP